MTNHQQRLRDLACETNEVAEELIRLVEFVARHSGKNKAWRSFRRALDAVFSKKKIDALSDRIDTLRNELILRVVVSLRTRKEAPLQSAALDSRFESLTDQSKDLARILLDNRNFFTTGFAKVLHSQEEAAEAARLRHEETVAALATLRGLSAVQPQSGVSRLDTLHNLDDIQETILRFLWFRFISDREVDISTAYDGTFQWVYNEPNTTTLPHNTLPDFLRSGEGCFWVNGKAGSGKSTLMKYLAGNSRTRELLAVWARGEPLFCASFYFWTAGTTLQKSQQGLLRSILHAVLSEHPELIPIAFPTHCRYFCRRKLDNEDPSLMELKAAFQLFTTQTIMPLRLCLWIDGIDEYDGDHVELVQYLRSSCSSRLKLILSSRPTPPCLAAFDSCPRLQLQDLTRNDIRTYVQGQLAEDSNYVRMIEESAAGHERHLGLLGGILDELVEKSSGVFLWVVLVVKCIRSGLQDRISIEDLLASVDYMPTELEGLYRGMLNQLSPFHKRQASMVFRIMYNFTKFPLRRQPLPADQTGIMTALKLSFALDGPDSSLDAEIAEISWDEQTRREDIVRGIVTNRCCGLLEVLLRKHSFQGTTMEVKFIHKSVLDFLDNADIQEDLKTITSSDDFDPNVWLAASSLRLLKGAVLAERTCEDTLDQALHECLLAEISTGQSQDLLFEDLYATMNRHWGASSPGENFWERFCPGPLNGTPGLSEPSLPKPALALACYAGLVRYVEKQICTPYANPIYGRCPHDNPPQPSPAQVAMDCVVLELLEDSWFEPILRESHFKILALALRSGADPNIRMYENGHSFWHVARDHSFWHVAVLPPFPRLKGNLMECTQHWARVLERLVQAGADVSSLIYDKPWMIELEDHTETNARWAMSPLAIIQRTILDIERKAALPSEARKIRMILGGLERLIHQRGGYSTVVVEEKVKLRNGEEWTVVSDPGREADIKRALRKVAKPYYKLWSRG